MAHTPPHPPTPPTWLGLGGLLCAVSLSTAAWTSAAQAQGVFRVMGPDGKVTFTDRPPSAPTTPAPASAGGAAASSADTTGSPLPLALRQAMARFPVVLYTGIECNACDVGRKHLVAQGVPHTEKTVTTQADADTLKQLSGGQTVPYVTIGKQGLKGYNETEWQRYLSAAGYPAKSALPTGYKNPAPAPLAVTPAGASTAAPAPDSSPANASTPTAPVLPGDTTVAPVPTRNTNPAGIRF